MAPIKLTYFNVSGLGDSIRFLLSHGGLNFEDCRIDEKEFLAKKQSFPVGQVPMLEIDGMTLYQSNTICRYLGKKLGLVGKTDRDMVMCDIMADNIMDLRVWLSMIYHESNAEVKEMKRDMVLKRADVILNKLNEEVMQNNGFLVGGQLTWVDFVLVGMSRYLSVMAGKDVFEGREALSNLRKKVLQLPKVQRFIQDRRNNKL